VHRSGSARKPPPSRGSLREQIGIERDFLLAQEIAALARGGIPGRSQAEQRIARRQRGPLVLVLLERLPAIKAVTARESREVLLRLSAN